jgi:hypothetical protein
MLTPNYDIFIIQAFTRKLKARTRMFSAFVDGRPFDGHDDVSELTPATLISEFEHLEREYEKLWDCIVAVKSSLKAGYDPDRSL